MATYRKLQVFVKTTDFVAATKVVQSPLEDPAPNEVRVKQIFAGCNATDMNITAARYNTDGVVPFGIGLEGLGIVDAIGSAVPEGSAKIGQPVLVFDRSRAQGFSEYAYATPDRLFPVPDLNPAYLVTLINGLTASIALDKAGHIKAGDKVLVTAAAGGTGQIVVQWAKQKGAYVIGLTSSKEKAAYLKELGADDVINYREENLDQVLTERYPDGLDISWETIGGAIFATLFSHLAVKGRIIVIGSITSYETEGFKDVPIPNLNALLLRGSKSLTGFMLTNYLSDAPEYLPQLITGISAGKLKAQVDLGERSPGGSFVGVDQIYRAQAWLHSGKNLGKVVVKLQNP